VFKKYKLKKDKFDEYHRSYTGIDFGVVCRMMCDNLKLSESEPQERLRILMMQ
jgi:hypothetical protein